jgi:hypothetical protein
MQYQQGKYGTDADEAQQRQVFQSKWGQQAPVKNQIDGRGQENYQETYQGKLDRVSQSIAVSEQGGNTQGLDQHHVIDQGSSDDDAKYLGHGASDPWGLWGDGELASILTRLRNHVTTWRHM